MSTLDAWRTKAACLDWYPEQFFEDVWPTSEEQHGGNFNPAALEKARRICSGCPVRRDCYAAAIEEEDGAKEIFRFGVRAGMTPAQRWSAEHRKAVRCPKCSTPLDPDSVRAGEIVCPEECAIDRTMPPIPDRGDRWTRRHTTLARKVLRWLVAEVPVGASIPRPRPLAESWKERVSDMTRVFEALVADGTLSFRDGKYWRQPNPGAARQWNPSHLALVEAQVA